MHPTQPAIAKEKFFFYEKNTGVSHFHVECDEQGRFPVEQGRVRLQLPANPGLYDLTVDDNSKPEKVFSVNPSSKESELAFETAPAALQAWQLNTRESARTTALNPVKLSMTAILQQRVWWWMLVAGLACLLLETAIAQGTRLKSPA